ncbi:hypothetical protein Q7C15_17470 [Aeromonas salmonicida]|uniref:hypothetical protein n=1 Tax=Aeromonas salmonicida TaxID=645 RepID=UPI0035C0108E
MSDILKIILEWPVIVQGSLGSGLFWVVLFLGQKAFEKSWEKYSIHSVKARRSWLINRSAVIRLRLTRPIDQQSFYASILMYRSSRYLFKALMWLALGLALEIIFSPISLIGFLGAIYYLIEGYSIVKGTTEDEENLKAELQKISEELSSLYNLTANSSSKVDGKDNASS